MIRNPFDRFAMTDFNTLMRRAGFDTAPA